MSLLRTTLVALALSAVGLPAPSFAQKVTMGSVGSASASLWPAYIGIKNKFFEAEGIEADLVFAPSNAGVNQQVAAGSLDLGLNSGLVDPIRAIEKGAPSALVRLEISPAPYALLAKANINSVADLRGTRI